MLLGPHHAGTTSTLAAAFPRDRVFYFAAAESTGQLARRELFEALERRLSIRPDPADYPTWESTFRMLLGIRGPRPIVTVLDEAHRLAGQEGFADGFRAALRADDPHSSALILAGEPKPALQALAGRSDGLRADVFRSILLNPLDFHDAGAIMSLTSRKERAIGYGVFGGLPGLLVNVAPGAPLADSIVQAALAPTGRVRVEVEAMLDRERGLRHQHEYRAILLAVGAGKALAAEIAEFAGTERGTSTARMLDRLVGLGYLVPERNFAARPNEAIRYRFADPAIRFQYEVVQRYRPELGSRPPVEVWTAYVAGALDDYMQRVFEDTARQAYLRLAPRLGLPPAVEWGRWQGTVTRGRGAEPRSYEVPVVARLADGRMLTGAARWGDIGVATHTQHLRALEVLADAGQTWARDALDPAAPFLYVTSGSVPWDLTSRAKEDGHPVLAWSLDDLYR